MGQIISGSIVFEERVPGPPEYAHKLARAEINFDVGENATPETAEALADAAVNLARRKVNDLLGRGVAQPVTTPSAHKAAGKADKGQGASVAKVQAAVTPTPANEPAPPTAPVEIDPVFGGAPAVAEKVLPVAELVAASQAEPAKESTDFDFGTGAGAPPADISDKELLAFITEHNEKIRNPAAINKLIVKYAGKPGANNIAKAVRPSFVDQLKLIKAGDI